MQTDRDQPVMRISEAALKLQVPRYYIDYWRKTGLLGSGGNLDFQDLLKIRFLASCRRQGVSLQHMRRLIRECEASSVSDWYNQLIVYDNLEGVLLSRDGAGLAHPDTGQMFFSYGETGEATSTAGGPGPVVDLEERLKSGQHSSGGAEPDQETVGKWTGGRGDPGMAVLEEDYLKLLASGDFRKISRVLEEIIRVQPDHVAALIEFGNLCYEHEKLDEALRYYDRAVEIQPDCVEALYNVANIHFKAKRYAVAIRNFQQCIELDPDFPEAYYNLGLLYYALRYFDQAIDCMVGYADLDPDSVWADQARQLIEDMESRRDQGVNSNPGLFE
ncbi:MAG: tetratricopeptide repeat protein [bacterium]|nr:tetratricopeptide repeat protein [bacterium]